MNPDTAKIVEQLRELARNVPASDVDGRIIADAALALARAVQPAYDQMQHLAYSAVVPAVIRSANDLDLLKILVGGKQSTGELVAQTGADKDLLRMNWPRGMGHELMFYSSHPSISRRIPGDRTTSC